MLNLSIAQLPVILLDFINRPSGETDCIYDANVKWNSTQPKLLSIHVNSKHERRKWPLKLISACFFLMLFCQISICVFCFSVLLAIRWLTIGTILLIKVRFTLLIYIYIYIYIYVYIHTGVGLWIPSSWKCWCFYCLDMAPIDQLIKKSTWLLFLIRDHHKRNVHLFITPLNISTPSNIFIYMLSGGAAGAWWYF